MDGKSLLFEYWNAFGSGNIDALEKLFHPDYIDHDVKRGQSRRLHEIRPGYLMWRSAFSNESEELIHFVQAENTISYVANLTATHTGDFMGIPATGRRIKVAGIAIFRYSQDEKLLESWRLTDQMTLFRQLRGEEIVEN